jgi:hypothetical protein
VYALNAGDGAELWVHRVIDGDIPEQVGSSPAVANGTVYVGADDLEIHALSEVTVDTTDTETTTTDTETTTTDTETTTSPSTDTPGSTSTESPTETTSSEATPTDTAPPATARTSTESETDARSGPTTGPATGTDTDERTADLTDTEQAGTETDSQETPGFGIGTALVSLGSGAYILKRRLNSGDDEQ